MNNNKRAHRSIPRLTFAALLAALLAACGSSGPRDTDKDGFADAQDCAVSDSGAWQTMAFASRDEDRDGRRVNASGSACVGSALPATLFAAAVPAAEADCNDADATRWALLGYVAVDGDRDGFPVAGSGEICSGAALPAGFHAALPAAADLDCNDADAAAWRNTAYASRDADGDGFRANQGGNFCGQGSLPTHLFAAAATSFEMDCDDGAAARWRWMGTYADADGDGVGAGAAARACMGLTAPAGRALTGYDPVDDPAIAGAALISNIELPSSLLMVPDDVDDDDIFP